MEGSALDLILAPEVAKRAGMTLPWVYARTRSGEIPCVRFGRYVRYRPEAVAAWIAEHERGSLASTGGAGSHGVLVGGRV